MGADRSEKGLLRGRVLAVPVDVLSTPRDGEVMTDRWWAVRDGRALFWQGRGNRRGWSPQCNHDRRIADSLVESIHQGASAEFIPIAYVGRWDEVAAFASLPFGCGLIVPEDWWRGNSRG